MAQIFSQSVLPLPKRTSLFSSSDNFYPIKHQSIVMPQHSDHSSQANRLPSESHSPMSTFRNILFEVTTPMGNAKEHRPRQELSQKRESLPPLSSILGGSNPRLLQGISSTYNSQSLKPFPVEPRRSSIAFHENKPPSRSSHVGKTSPPPPPPPPPPPSSLPSLSPTGSRRANPIRIGFPQNIPPSLPIHRAKSPSFDSQHTSHDKQSSQLSYARTTWSPPQQSHQDHVSELKSTSLRTNAEYLPSPKFIPERERSRLHDAQHPSTSSADSQTPNTSDYPLTTKDGLGPKIWTGTNFLPRFVCQAEVPGEGICYFYDDGTHCKSVIDGEMVNAHWGVTKTGKPRKRLAIACITCREKKIKCDPDYPRCVQCEKYGRICRFKNAWVLD